MTQYFDSPLVANILGKNNFMGQQQSMPMGSNPYGFMGQQQPMPMGTNPYGFMGQQQPMPMGTNPYGFMGQQQPMPMGTNPYGFMGQQQSMPMGTNQSFSQAQTINPMFSMLNSLLPMIMQLSMMSNMGAPAPVETETVEEPEITFLDIFRGIFNNLLGINPEETKENIATNTENIGTNTEAIATNTETNVAQDEAISENEEKDREQDTVINTNSAQINTNANAIEDNNEVDEAQQNAINDNTADINANAQLITNLQTQIAALQEQLNSNDETDVVQQEQINDNIAAINANNTADVAQQGQINNNSAQIIDLASIINSELWIENNIDKKELDLVEGEDLLQKDINGNPEYLIAKGRTDGEHHIYKHNRNYGSNNSKAQYRSVSNIAGDKLKNGSNYLYLSTDATKKDANGALEARTNNSINSNDWGHIQVSGSYSTGSPLILDTDGDGQIEVASGVGVDVNNDGSADGAATNGDKMLAMSDLNGNGKIDGSEVFGNETINPFTGEKINAENGFEALKVIAEAAEAKSGLDVISDAGIVNIKSLQETLAAQNIGLGLISDDNVTDLEGLKNISSIGTSFTELPETDGKALHLQKGSYITEDGEERLVHDVWFDLD